MRSMTGHGRGEATRQGVKLVIEATSVNRKQSEVNLNLPRDLEILEPRFREETHRYIARGRLTARVSIQSTEGGSSRMRVNHELAKAYYRDFSKLRRELKLSDDVSLDQILRTPGVLENSQAIGDPEAFWPSARRALQQALRALVEMRKQEGKHLAEDLKTRIQAMRQSVNRARKRSPKIVERYRQQLKARLEKFGLNLSPDDQMRLDKEVVLFADRSDISEEISRLESHFQQFDQYSKRTDSIGRTLDFLAQEMNREINTIGSKANDSVISQEVVLLKTELEKFREQAQNVE